MNHRREFEIAYIGLKDGISQYEYQIDNKFFENLGFDHSDFNSINAIVRLSFDKKTNFFLLKFDVDGIVDVACDRCGDNFELKLWDEFNLVVKLTSEDSTVTHKEEEDDVVFIPRHETVIDISEWIYEFIRLSLPLQRVHPDKEGGTEGCNEAALKILKQLTDAHEDDKTKVLWKGLEALKKKQ